ncbi:penicillin-binding transpeptidase domain-containing protein [Gemmatimonas sp.]|jgi:cell division protein FtsI (penicillin-binding protein 3)|uniref:penicillin-binding transpeptidase domain-containing protein n=1 Tax=Gemmatimonas sp. TaxID=1962908 RepID=UPI0037C000D8
MMFGPIRREVDNAPRFAPEDAGASANVSRVRSMIVHAGLVLFAVAILARAVQLQIVEHDSWLRVADRQHVSQQTVKPLRGAIIDATGTVLVESREQVKLSIAPREIRDVRRKNAKRGDPLIKTRAAIRSGLRALSVPEAQIRKALDTNQKWVSLPKLYLPSDVERLAGLPGVHVERVRRRINAASDNLRGVLGAVDADDMPVGGIELELDSLLRGRAGSRALMKDPKAGYVESPELSSVDALPGHSVTLTLNQALQEIAENELKMALARTDGTGGDVVILDPRDGSVLALAGVRDGKPASTSTPMALAYEPGSVMKPFLVSRLLDMGKATPNEIINTENGSAMLPGRKRPLTDEHKAAQMPVRDVIRFSSNIGTAKLALRLSPREEFESMRDFGFGSLTGVPYPAESKGSLPLPARWSGTTQTAVAIGYEVTATPLQIALAYAAIANGGELLQPALVKEVRDAQGTTIYRHQRRVVRRVLTAKTASAMRGMLASVVDSGTGTAAELATYDVAGKSGTARRSENGRYLDGKYNATFAGMFPAQAPQYVLVARLIDPKGTYYGGIVSGSLVNGILQAALATRNSALDRNALAEVAKALPVPVAKPKSEKALALAARDSARRDSLLAPPPPKAEPAPAAARVVVALPFVAPPALVRDARDARDVRPVPSVFGLDVRQATRTLYAAGFQVSIARGTDVRTRPAAGALLRVGSTVQLEMPGMESPK